MHGSNFPMSYRTRGYSLVHGLLTTLAPDSISFYEVLSVLAVGVSRIPHPGALWCGLACLAVEEPVRSTWCGMPDVAADGADGWNGPRYNVAHDRSFCGQSGIGERCGLPCSGRRCGTTDGAATGAVVLAICRLPSDREIASLRCFEKVVLCFWSL